MWCVFLVCSGQYLAKAVQWRNSSEPKNKFEDLPYVVQSSRWATVVQIAKNVNAGSDWKWWE